MESNAEKNRYIAGKVIHGEGRGKKIGFPTANIDFTDWHYQTGVYGVRVYVNDACYYGVMNIGVKPTFHKNASKNVEIHIIKFNENIYGKQIEVEVIFKVRDEQKFNSVHELIRQIKKDIAFTKHKFHQMGMNRKELS
ncbi:riboflavin kinase [Aneurinibacillus sp. UBA3580]|jgi:riboflavin kinase/FMN adenylyltransferase|uniref:riboflavin kinase n=1 Tax=Aneurinibacillus sp. UBA3580 TaxID=1946041 RepID=UPI00257E69FE|nr:riboflavin kinase [Aneurinibacillus sp. UBA3580]